MTGNTKVYREQGTSHELHVQQSLPSGRLAVNGSPLRNGFAWNALMNDSYFSRWIDDGCPRGWRMDDGSPSGII